jgi:catechol 2,3-dioxygenase-like lactoylglutathione lyase family enzyme
MIRRKVSASVQGGCAMAIVGLDTAVFTAPDMKKAKAFLADWGLKKVRDGRKGAVFATRIGSEIVLRPDDYPGLPPAAQEGMHFREMIWGVSSRKHLAAIRKELERDREVTVDADGTIHCLDPNNIGVGFRRWQREKRVEATPERFNHAGHYRRIDARAKLYERAQPLRMGHIGFIVPNLEAAEKFYHKRLGFPISDKYAGGAATFMRNAEREDHHNLFLIWSRDGNTRFHHIAFEVNDIHEVFGGGLYVTRKQGWQTEVGPGRHPVSSAYFWYVKTPLGGAFEYFSDSDFVTGNWKPVSFRENRFSEWHLVDGIPAPEEGYRDRPSLSNAGKA